MMTDLGMKNKHALEQKNQFLRKLPKTLYLQVVQFSPPHKNQYLIWFELILLVSQLVLLC